MCLDIIKRLWATRWDRLQRYLVENGGVIVYISKTVDGIKKGLITKLYSFFGLLVNLLDMNGKAKHFKRAFVYLRFLALWLDETISEKTTTKYHKIHLFPDDRISLHWLQCISGSFVEQYVGHILAKRMAVSRENNARFVFMYVFIVLIYKVYFAVQFVLCNPVFLLCP